MEKGKEGGRDWRKLSIDRIWDSYQSTRKDCYKNLLIEHYRDLARYAAERLKKKLPEKIQLDDLISAGIFGLEDAIEYYDPKRGVKFETYCTKRIRGSMIDELRETDWVPRLVRIRAHKLAKVTQHLESILGRKPNDNELADELGMTEKEFKTFKENAVAAKMQPLDQLSYIEEPQDQPIEHAKREELKRLLTQGFSRAEKLIVTLYYYEGLNHKEIGKAIDLSESRVSQIHKMLRERLKGILTRKYGYEGAIEFLKLNSPDDQ